MKNLLVFIAFIGLVSPQASAFGVQFKTAYQDTYLTRLLDKDPERYQICLDRGPTPENEAGKYCARATRTIYDCARNTSGTHCGKYAFTYSGRGCLERRGMVNLLEHLDEINPRYQNQVCNVPGTILVFEGRCHPKPGAMEPMSFKECRELLIGIEGEDAFRKRMEKVAQGDEVKGTLGDRVGHMEIVAFKSPQERNVLQFISYTSRTVPASHFENSRTPHGLRLLSGCYLPQDDARAVLEALK